MLSSLRHVFRSIRKNTSLTAETNPSNQVEYHLRPTTLPEFLNSTASIAVEFLPTQLLRPRDMVLPFGDLIAIAALCRVLQPQAIFEIGTYTGETTRILCSNAPPNSHVWTLDLPPDDRPEFFETYLAGEAFHGTVEAPRITQLWGRSERFDFDPFQKRMNLVFIDGDHSYEGVARDTENALKIVADGGVIVWDDYQFLPCHQSCAGVSQYLHSRMHDFPLFQLSGTRLAIMRFA